MKEKNKKLLKKIVVSVGSLTTVVAPVVSTVAFQSNTSVAKSSNSYDAELKAAIANSSISTDGIYFWGGAYSNGSIWSSQTAAEGHRLSDANNKLVAMNSNTNTYSYDQTVEFGDEDKFFVAFNNDDNDGLSPQNFEQEFFFEDSSYHSTPVLDAWNEQQGNSVQKTPAWTELLVGFRNGESNQYVGSQAMHSMGTQADALARIRNDVPQNIYNEITRSGMAFPIYLPNGLFTYQKVTDRVFEVTFHYDEQNKPITAAYFRLRNKNTGAFLNYPTWSLGDQNEWKYYEAHPEAKYIARKDVFINKK